MNFKIGDTVRLKSGGPLMTVSELEGGFIGCEWFDDKDQRQFGTFHPAILELDDRTPPRNR